ncbi:MAG: hypothetical protein E7560_00385 [Ruminococcaceae bacterium]|nr:hypothetical protein [Oscillospiraceae bacterium]
MKYNLPQRITSEKDLSVYEEYLKCDLKKSGFGSADIRDLDFNMYLNAQKNKFARVEICVGSLLQTKTGVIFAVGSDYIVLKQNNGCETAIPFAAIRALTITQARYSRKTQI